MFPPQTNIKKNKKQFGVLRQAFNLDIYRFTSLFNIIKNQRSLSKNTCKSPQLQRHPNFLAQTLDVTTSFFPGLTFATPRGLTFARIGTIYTRVVKVHGETLSKCGLKKGHIRKLSPMLNVWPIYLHLGSFGGKCR